MPKRIRDLDFAEITGKIMQSTNVATRKSADWITQDVLRLVKSKTAAARVLRSTIAVAAVSKVQSPSNLTFEQPLVRAFVVAHRHPLAVPVELGRLDTDRGIDCAPRLLEMAGGHPEVRLASRTSKLALIDAIGFAAITKSTTRLHRTLHALGDISVSWDAAENHEDDEAVEKFERMKSIRPLKLD